MYFGSRGFRRVFSGFGGIAEIVKIDCVKILQVRRWSVLSSSVGCADTFSKGRRRRLIVKRCGYAWILREPNKQARLRMTGYVVTAEKMPYGKIGVFVRIHRKRSPFSKGRRQDLIVKRCGYAWILREPNKRARLRMTGRMLGLMK